MKKGRPCGAALEYRGGYALIGEGEMRSLLDAYRHGNIKKVHFRVWAARHEQSVLHAKSKVTLDRILNCKSQAHGVKRLPSRAVEAAKAALDGILPGGAAQRRAVSRQALRAMAQGRFSCVEAIVFLMYALRRISQGRSLKRLLPDERYARFTYGDLEEISGVDKANISRAVSSLKTKGFLATVWVVKQNENQFGLLFVDGPLLSLIPGAARDRSLPAAKKPTPEPKNANTPRIILPTLKKDNPKREIQKEERSLKFERKGTLGPEFERIIARARAMEQNFIEQAA